MVSMTSAYFKLLICFVLLCTFIQFGHTRSIVVDDEEDQIENSLMNKYGSLNDHLYGKNLVEDLYYNKNSYTPDDIQLAKRIIMLPRVGRRSIPSS